MHKKFSLNSSEKKKKKKTVTFHSKREAGALVVPSRSSHRDISGGGGRWGVGRGRSSPLASHWGSPSVFCLLLTPPPPRSQIPLCERKSPGCPTRWNAGWGGGKEAHLTEIPGGLPYGGGTCCALQESCRDTGTLARSGGSWW